MGKEGELMMMFMILMAITSTGAAEVIAVASILVYDIYGIHLKPYRRVIDANSCILCGKQRGRMANPRDKCECWSMTYCADCSYDDSQIEQNKRRVLKPDYKCTMHGQYRRYVDYLSRLKNWCLMWTTISIFPLTILLNAMQLSLGWVYLFMGILIGSAVLPISLAMSWSRMTSHGMMTGTIGGAALAVITWLSVASSFEGGLSNFLVNTGREVSMLSGNLVAIVSGGLLSVFVSLATNRNYASEQAKEVWESTRDIDNPLSPWTEMYARELRLSSLHQLDNRPSLEDVERTFRSAKLVAIIGSLSLTFTLLILLPLTIITVNEMTLAQFTGWIHFAEAFAYIATVFIIVVPVINEIYVTKQAMAERKIAPVDLISTAKKKSTICVAHASSSRKATMLRSMENFQTIEEPVIKIDKGEQFLVSSKDTQPTANICVGDNVNSFDQDPIIPFGEIRKAESIFIQGKHENNLTNPVFE